jgi:hypothetical protein
MHADPVATAHVATGSITAGHATIAEVAGNATAIVPARAITAAAICTVIRAALQVPHLLNAGVPAFSLRHYGVRAARLGRIGAVCVEQEQTIDQRTAASRREDHGSEAQSEHVFHSEIPS